MSCIRTCFFITKMKPQLDLLEQFFLRDVTVKDSSHLDQARQVPRLRWEFAQNYFFKSWFLLRIRIFIKRSIFCIRYILLYFYILNFLLSLFRKKWYRRKFAQSSFFKNCFLLCISVFIKKYFFLAKYINLFCIKHILI